MNFSTSLICCNLENIDTDITNILKSSNGDSRFTWFHADFMDGHFVPRLGISPELIQHIRKKFGNSIIIDSHLMIDDPFTYADVIAPYSDYYMFHAEATTDPMRTIQKIRKNWPNVKVGLYFNLSTKIDNYIDILPEIDCIGLMGISPGVLGTNSYKDIIVKKLHNIIDLGINSKEVFIDGSVNFNTIPEYNSLNVRTVVCGSSSMFKIDDFTRNFDRETLVDYNIKRIKRLV